MSPATPSKTLASKHRNESQQQTEPAQTWREPQGKLLEDEKATTSARSVSVQTSTPRTRRETPGELLEEGHKRQAPKHQAESNPNEAITNRDQEGMRTPNLGPNPFKHRQFQITSARILPPKTPAQLAAPNIMSRIASNATGDSQSESGLQHHSADNSRRPSIALSTASS